jgi:hypothetical protein
MRGSGRVWQAAVVTAGFAMLPGIALAQSANDFRLPSASPTTTPPPRIQGPVDPDNPVITSPRPAPRPVPSSTVPTPSPSTVPSAAQPSSAPQPSPTAARPTASPRQPLPTRGVQAGSSLAPAAQGPAPVGTLAPSGPGGAAPLPSETPIFSTLPGTSTAPAPALAKPATGWPDWLPFAAAALAALLAALGGLIWWRRRKIEAPVTVAFERPIVPAEPTAEPALVAATPNAAAEAVAPAAPAPATAATQPRDVHIALEARRMNASLMATTLSYQLSVTNHTATALSALAIEGDMIAAHGTLPPEQQVARKTQQLELRHAVVELAPGETAVLTGDIRVPLELITPIRAGTAAFFVPLARFRVSAGPLVAVQTFVIGEAPETAGAALKPFRLDLGPRTYSRISQRALD